MKKKFQYILFILAVILLSGCNSQSKPLRVCIDLGLTTWTSGQEYKQSAMEDIAYFMRHTYDIAEEDIIFEYIPHDGSERKTTLDRLRTEIMSGGGPDVFIVECAGGSPWMHDEPLFNIPEKALEMDLFLPLDEYIENAQFAEWSNFTSSVMAGGRKEEGQQIVPLRYTLPIAMYRAEEVTHIPSKMTWDELINNAELIDTAARLGDGYNSIGSIDHRLDYVLGKLADYSEEELSFSEEELLYYAESLLALNKYTADNNLLNVPYRSEGSIGPGFNTTGGKTTFDQFGRIIDGGISIAGGNLNGLTDRDTLCLVPFYSVRGGCTAMVTAFAAVNRNTEQPQEAFTIIDLLLSTDRQRGSDLYTEILYDQRSEASMPIHENIMSRNMPISYNTLPDYSLSNENFSVISAVREQITNVQFAGEFNTVLENMMRECADANMYREDYSEIVHEAYTTMKQMMAE